LGRNRMNAVVLRVVGWNKGKAWTDNISHTRGMLIGLLRESTALSHLEAKRLVKAILAGEASELPLANPRFYNSMRHALESIGAEVEIHEVAAQQGAPADGPASRARG
jgi:hypothetical protein